MTMHSDVRDFHIAFGLPVAEIPGLPDADQRALRRKLLAEEHQEYHESEDTNDFVNLAKELADILYIINGTLVVYGLPGHDPMTILFGNGVPGFPTGVLTHSRQTRRDEITKAYAAYVAAEEADDLAQIAATLRQLTDAVFTCSYTYNIPILQVFAEVHRSNLAKLVDGKVLRRADGKVLKPESWTPANIEPILFPQT